MSKITKLLLLSLLSLSLVGCGKNKSEKEEVSPEIDIKKTTIGNEEIGYFTIKGEFEDVSGENDYLIYQNKETGVVITLKKYDKIFDEIDVDYVKQTTEKNLKKSFKEAINVQVLDFKLLGSIAEGNLVRAESSYKGVDFYMDVYLVETLKGTIYMSIEGFNVFEDIHNYTDDLLDQFIIL